jgi:hypothetical protein
MAATAGNIVLVDVATGEKYTVECYIPDAIATNYTFATIGLAVTTSPTYWSAPTDCVLTEIMSVVAPTAVGGTITFDGSPVKNHTFRHALQLGTLATRQGHKLFVPAGTQVGVLQF